MIQLPKDAGCYISKLSNKVRRHLDTFAANSALSGAQGRVLHFLLAQTEAIFQKDIEEEFGMRASTVSELLKQMEKNGFIERKQMPYDGRLKQIIVTEKGLCYKAQVITDLATLEKKITKDISTDELELFFKVAEKMMRNLSD